MPSLDEQKRTQLLRLGQELIHQAAASAGESARRALSGKLPLGPSGQLAVCAFSRAFQVEQEAELRRFGRKPVSPETLVSLERHITALQSCVDERGSLPRREAVRGAVQFQRHQDGTLSLIIPDRFDTIALIDAANAEARARGMRPLCTSNGLRWFSENLGRPGVLADRGKQLSLVVQEDPLEIEDDDGSSSADLRGRTPAPLEAILVAGMCNVIAGSAKRCLLGESMRPTRGAVQGVWLYRLSHWGFDVSTVAPSEHGATPLVATVPEEPRRPGRRSR